MSRERISATVESDVKQQLDQQDINASGLVNKLLKQYFATGGNSEDMLKLRREQIQSDIEQHRSSIQSLQNELETVNAKLNEIQEEHKADLSEAREVLADVPKEPDNPAIQHWADELDMEPTDLIDEVTDDGV